MDIPIHSIREGVVLHALPDDGKEYGARVYIRNIDGSVCMYAHLESFCVRAGDRVREKQTIGMMGSTGTDNKHLHLSWFPAGSSSLTSAYARDPTPYVIVYGMPCRSEAIVPYGSAVCHPKIAEQGRGHEGIDFGGHPKRILQTLDGLQGGDLYLQRVPV